MYHIPYHFISYTIWQKIQRHLIFIRIFMHPAFISFLCATPFNLFEFQYTLQPPLTLRDVHSDKKYPIARDGKKRSSIFESMTQTKANGNIALEERIINPNTLIRKGGLGCQFQVVLPQKITTYCELFIHCDLLSFLIVAIVPERSLCTSRLLDIFFPKATLNFVDYHRIKLIQ